jgi:hypothetical protein
MMPRGTRKRAWVTSPECALAVGHPPFRLHEAVFGEQREAIGRAVRNKTATVAQLSQIGWAVNVPVHEKDASARAICCACHLCAWDPVYPPFEVYAYANYMTTQFASRRIVTFEGFPGLTRALRGLHGHVGIVGAAVHSRTTATFGRFGKCLTLCGLEGLAENEVLFDQDCEVAVVNPPRVPPQSSVVEFHGNRAALT